MQFLKCKYAEYAACIDTIKCLFYGTTCLYDKCTIFNKDEKHDNQSIQKQTLKSRKE